MKLKIVLLLLTAFLLSCLNIATNELANTRAKNTQAELVKIYEEEGYRFFSVSPNGKYAAADFTHEYRCIRIVELNTMSVIYETPVEIRSFDFNYFSWSPDSTKAVITENLLRSFFDSDLWILDFTAKKTYHLFPDETDHLVLFQSETGFGEYQPTWSPGSDSIALTRSEYSKKNTVIGLVDDFQKSEFTAISILSSDIPFLSCSGLFWQTKYLYFTQHGTRKNDPVNGIYRMKSNGAGLEKIIGSDEKFGDLILIDVGSDEKYALAVYFAYNEMFQMKPSHQSNYRLLDLKNLTNVSLITNSEDDWQFNTTYAVFSPSGNKVVSINYNINEGFPVILVQDTGSNDTYKLFGGEDDQRFIFGTSLLGFRSPLFWTSDDLLFVIAENGNKILQFKLTEDYNFYR